MDQFTGTLYQDNYTPSQTEPSPQINSVTINGVVNKIESDE